jgi:hypothetical protein
MAVRNPDIPNYKPFYIQKNGHCYDTRTEWNLIAKTNPYPALPTPKEPYKNSWPDENGDDEYVTNMYYEAFTFDVQFYIRATTVEEIRSALSYFFFSIKEGEFEVYDATTGLGRQKVRYAGFKEEMVPILNGGYARCIFTVTFKVNDPVTFMSYNSRTGKIVETF